MFNNIVNLQIIFYVCRNETLKKHRENQEQETQNNASYLILSHVKLYICIFSCVL